MSKGKDESKEHSETPDKIVIGAEEVDVKPDSLLGRIYSLPPRLFGALLLSVGLIYGKFEIYDQLEKARQHAPEVHHSDKLVAVIIFCLGAGLVLLIGGKSADRLLTKVGDRRKNTWLDNALLITAVVLTFGVMWYVNHLFEQLGYR